MAPTVSPTHYDVFTVVSSLALACFVAWLVGRAVRNKKEEKELQLEAFGVSPSLLLHRQTSAMTHETIVAVLSGGGGGGGGEAAEDHDDDVRKRELLHLIQDVRLGQDRLALRKDERHGVLRAIRDGASADEARARLQRALKEQGEADMRSLEAASVNNAGRVHGRHILEHAATLLAARDLAGAMGACRSLRQMLPNAVYALDGFAEHTTDDVIIGLAQRFPRTTCIDLGGCRNLTDAAIIAIADNCPELGSLNVDGCENLTDAAIIAVADNCPKLGSLVVRSCGNLTDAAIIAIADKCPQLGSLDVRCCNNLTDAAIIAVADKCPKLGSLNVRGCSGVGPTEPHVCLFVEVRLFVYTLRLEPTKP